MLIKNIFAKDIERRLDGVIRVDKHQDTQLIELDEYVVTTELKKHFETFFGAYKKAYNNRTPDIGVWISGFFGSGKSHFIKILSYLLKNSEIDGKRAVQYFDNKISDNFLLGDIKSVGDSSADILLFNIDSKSDAEARTNKEAIVKVFNKVFNSMLGFSENMPWLAELERQMVKNKTYETFKKKFKVISGDEWENKRDDFYFEEDNIVAALAEAGGLTSEAARNIYEKAESNYTLTIEGFAKKVREYVESKGKNHRVVFMVDEMGQYIGDNSQLMLNLQTIVENLGDECGGRAWVIVTSQEAIDEVSKKIHSIDFSKIQGRFATRLSMSSSDVDEVIKKRILEKNDGAKLKLFDLYNEKSSILKNLITFSAGTPFYKSFKSEKDFSDNYPFLPYQFNLLQSVFNGIRTRGASGKHLSEGERSLLSAFKESAARLADKEIGVLVSFDKFYETIESFLDHDVKIIMKNAQDAIDSGALEKFDSGLLKVLFMLKELDDKMPATAENLTTLLADNIDCDKIILRKKVEDGLRRLLSQKLIQRDGDKFIFLTNDEQDVNREIDRQTLETGEIVLYIGNYIFNGICDIKYKYSSLYNFAYNQMIDERSRGAQSDELTLSVYTPFINDVSDDEVKFKTAQSKIAVIRLPKDTIFAEEIIDYLKLTKYLKTRPGRAASETVKRIITIKESEVSRKEERIEGLIDDLVKRADIFVNANKLAIREKPSKERINEALKVLVESTYTKLNYITKFITSSTELNLLIKNDTNQLSFAPSKPNELAINEISDYLKMQFERNLPTTVKTIADRFTRIPYGWQDFDIAACLVALFKAEEIKLEMAGKVVALHDDLVSYLTKKEQKERLLIKLKIKTSRELIDKAIFTLKSVFAESVVYDTDEKLKDIIHEKLDIEHDEINKYYTYYSNIGGFHIASATNALGFEYPGKQVIAEYKELLDKVKKIYDVKVLFESFTENQSKIENYRLQISDIKHFFKNQRAYFDKACKTLEIHKKNINYIAQKDAIALIEEISSIVKDTAPYKSIHMLPDYCDKYNSILVRILEEASKPVEKQIDEDYKAVDEIFKYYSLYTREYIELFESLRQRLKTTNQMSEILGIGEESKKFKVRLIDYANDAVAESQKEKPESKKWVIADLNALVSGFGKIETEDDIKKLMQKIESELKAMLKSGSIINLK